jgi:hypothetical protein
VLASLRRHDGDVVCRTVTPSVTAMLGMSLGLDVEMAILKRRASYEAVHSGPVAFDVLGRGRCWFREADLSSAVPGSDRGRDRSTQQARMTAPGTELTLVELPLWSGFQPLVRNA